MVYSINLDSRTDMSISEIESKVGSLRDGKSYQSIICHFTEVDTKDMWMISNSYRTSHLCITLKISEHKSALKNCDICLKKEKEMKVSKKCFVCPHKCENIPTGLCIHVLFPLFHIDNICRYAPSYDEAVLLYLTEHWL